MYCFNVCKVQKENEAHQLIKKSGRKEGRLKKNDTGQIFRKCLAPGVKWYRQTFGKEN